MKFPRALKDAFKSKASIQSQLLILKNNYKSMTQHLEGKKKDSKKKIKVTNYWAYSSWVQVFSCPSRKYFNSHQC